VFFIYAIVAGNVVKFALHSPLAAYYQTKKASSESTKLDTCRLLSFVIFLTFSIIAIEKSLAETNHFLA
jgi:cytosine/uracil/thiamine/allantoin permease